MRSAFGWRGALGKLEVANACAPVERRCRSVILVRVIESTIVHRINGYIAVVAPAAAGVSLASSPIKKMLFTRQDVQRIGNQSACIANLRINRAAGGAKAECEVALLSCATLTIHRKV